MGQGNSEPASRTCYFSMDPLWQAYAHCSPSCCSQKARWLPAACLRFTFFNLSIPDRQFKHGARRRADFEFGDAPPNPLAKAGKASVEVKEGCQAAHPCQTQQEDTIHV